VSLSGGGAKKTADLDDERWRALTDAGGFIVSELDLDAVLARVLDTARELTGARYAALGVLNADRSELERFVTRGIDPETERAIGELPRGRGVLGSLIHDPKPLRLSSVGAHPASYGFPSGHPPMESFLGVPVLIRGEAWGNLYLTEKEGGEFDQSDEDAAVVLARWTSIAVDNARLFERTEQQRRELERAVRGLEATQTIALVVGTDMDLERILELIVKRGRALVGARSVVILLREGHELVLTASAGHTRRPQGERIPVAGSTSGEVMVRGVAERVSDVRARLRISPERFGVDDARSALLVPLAHRGEPLGVLIAFDKGVEAVSFTDEDEHTLKAFAASAGTAVATAQSVAKQRLRDALAAADAERRRWAQELHDETLQGLGGLRVLLASARRGGDPDALGEAADQAIEQIEQDITNLRAIITELRPAALDQLGLHAALEALFERHRTVSDLEVHSQIGLPDATQAGAELATELQTTPELQATLYRLVQEALTNVAKHARASAVDVVLSVDAGTVTVEITDDGVGFVVDGISSGFGLTGMRERVLMAGGALTLDSSDQGTTVLATLPLNHDADSSNATRPPGARLSA
jgi:signal transduction histidine kinase